MRLHHLTASLAAAALACALGVSGTTPTASAATGVGAELSDSSYAPVNRPGPALRASKAELRAAMTCSGDFGNGKQPVLLVPGTAFTYESQFSWSWAAALTREGIPWCSVTPPYNSLGDLTIAGEYDAFAIRYTSRLAGGRKIAVVGHSQGGMRPRWALRWWPDVRRLVADHVGVAPDNQGVTANAPGLMPALTGTACQLIGCPQGVWQQLQGSDFIAAVNSRTEAFAGIDYTVVYSKLDGLVAAPTTRLHDVPADVDYRRIAVQDICQLRVADHLTNGTVDSVSWALILDALTHRGPADPARVKGMSCVNPFLPGLDYADALAGAARAPIQIANAIATTPRENAEAALPCYVYAEGC